MVKGILPVSPVTIIDVTWYGNAAVEITYKDQQGQTGQEILYRDREPSLELLSPGQTWQLDADGAKFRLVSEAYRIRLAHLFDPMLAVHTSIIEPLPHQITAVYGEMLSRQPLRYLLADDPGAGKTIMAGLFIRELLIRGDLKRCLICAPGSLVEQWQEELSRRFQLPFEIISRQSFQDSLSGNPFAEKNLIICRLDHLSRNDDIQEKLKQTDWDLIIVDEAHKILTALNKPEDFFLAVVTVEDNRATGLTYLARPFNSQPDFGATSVNYDLNELLTRGEQLA